MSHVVAALREVTKVYPYTVAARNISIEFLGGEVHALVGENGAGKSTLVKMLAGIIQPDSGNIEVNGQRRRLRNPHASLAAGIGVVHQSGSLIESLTVGENLDLGKIFAPQTNHELETDQAVSVLTPEIPLGSFVSQLSPRQRQLVEIHRLLLQKARLLVLDESTSTLSPQESSLLFADLSLLARAGYAVVVVSHKLPELLIHCDRFTVLRKGRVVGRVSRKEATIPRLIKLFSEANVGSAAVPFNVAKSSEDSVTANQGNELVRLKNVCTDGYSEAPPLYDVNLVLRRGEILGIAGRPGSGATSVVEILRKGGLRLAGGSVDWNKDLETYGSDSRIGFVPADRMNRGMIGNLTIGENLMLRQRHLFGQIGSAWKHNERRKFLSSLIHDFDIRPPRSEVMLNTLSGGNAQKTLLAREMEYSRALLIVESPTAGLDMGSADFVRSVLRRKAENGACVVVRSDDLDELAELSNRVVVFCGGKCVAELLNDRITAETLGLALSQTNSEPPFGARERFREAGAV
ncbi:MAG TPA: ATP-binding cassette domain-containing protein [Pyrinomonadaceae bacterium]|nr:ATP-binding cassette domain-containing protein [Pyrinomonadaceae bacterium]